MSQPSLPHTIAASTGGAHNLSTLSVGDPPVNWFQPSAETVAKYSKYVLRKPKSTRSEIWNFFMVFEHVLHIQKRLKRWDVDGMCVVYLLVKCHIPATTILNHDTRIHSNKGWHR
jgi:hypothetical protein